MRNSQKMCIFLIKKCIIKKRMWPQKRLRNARSTGIFYLAFFFLMKRSLLMTKLLPSYSVQVHIFLISEYCSGFGSLIPAWFHDYTCKDYSTIGVSCAGSVKCSHQDTFPMHQLPLKTLCGLKHVPAHLIQEHTLPYCVGITLCKCSRSLIHGVPIDHNLRYT